MYRMIVAGSRDFSDYDYLAKMLDGLSAHIADTITILCGECRGADRLGKRYAIEHGYDVASYPADWKKYGKSAGYIRNREMAKNADSLVAFWNGVSRGTKHMIDLATEYGLEITVIRV